LLAVEFAVAICVAAATVWFVGARWFSVVSEAAAKMPDHAALRNGELEGVPSQRLAETKFLALIIDLDRTEPGQVADLQVDLSRRELNICSLFGCAAFPYDGAPLPLGRASLEPWWGAWQPIILACLGLALVLSLFVGWSALALILMWPVRILAFFADRDISLRGCWRLACAAQMPGAMFMTLAILLYGLQGIDLVRLLVAYGVHALMAFIYVFIAPFFLPRLFLGKGKNPFA
jgi:hypothetical protein